MAANEQHAVDPAHTERMEAIAGERGNIVFPNGTAQPTTAAQPRKERSDKGSVRLYVEPIPGVRFDLQEPGARQVLSSLMENLAKGGRIDTLVRIFDELLDHIDRLRAKP